MMAEWQPIMGFEGRYEISDCGSIRRVGGPLLNPWPNGQGYMIVRLTDTSAKKREQLRVHRLVAQAFIPNPDGLPFVNHIDANPANNRASNLEWCTQAQNLRHAAQLGRMSNDYWVGKRSPNAGLLDSQVRNIRNLYASGEWTYEQLARRHETSKRTIGRIIRGEYYSDVA